MKTKILVGALAAAMLSGCNSMAQKPDTETTQQKLLSKVVSGGDNGKTRIERGSEDFAFVLDVDAGDKDIELVMLNETSAEYDARTSGVQNFDMSEFLHKSQLDLAVSHLIHAQTLAYSNNLIQSLEMIEKALVISPTSTQALSMRGSILLQLGKTSEAEKSWQKALSYDSTLSGVKAHLEAIK